MNRLPIVTLVAFIGVSSFADAGDARMVSARRIDGTEVNGALQSLDLEGVVLEANGETIRIERGDLAVLQITGDGLPEAESMPWSVVTAGGSQVECKLLEGSPERLVFGTRWSERMALPFERLVRITSNDPEAPPAARDLLDIARRNPPTGKDTLITRQDEPKAVRGTLLELGPISCEFEFNDRARRLGVEKVFAIAFAKSTATTQTPNVIATVAGDDVIAGELVDVSTNALRIRAAGSNWEFPLAQVRSIAFRSGRIVYLSELEPASQHLSEIVIANRSYHRNRNVAGGPIVLGGQTYPRGIGMRSRCALTYKLDGAYETFAATVGIDDAVRPNGSVEFQVQVDGQDKAANVLATGTDKPQALRVDVTGAAELTLIVDFADNADVGDWADWAGARLIAPLQATDR